MGETTITKNDVMRLLREACPSFFESEHWAECRSGIEDEPGDEPLLYWWPRRSPYT